MLSITILVAAAALSVLNFGGALDLTGSLALATVLGCVATAQWAAARQALMLARLNPDARQPLPRWCTVGMLVGFYFIAAAWITVPLSAAKLDQLLGVAKEVQQTRFDDEQASIRRRAKDVGAAYNDLAARLRQLKNHALAMRDLEAAKGGSCLTSRGDKPGEIYRWRDQEFRLAGELVDRAAEPLGTAASIVDTVTRMRLDATLPVRDAERTLVAAVDDLNRLTQAPVLGTLREYVRQADEAGREIQIPRAGGLGPEKFNCVDTQRTATLAGMFRSIEVVQKFPPLPGPLLMDASSSQDIAKAKLIGAWSVVIGTIPTVSGSRLIDPVLQKRYRMSEGFLLSGPRISWGLAWALEGLLLVLIALQVNDIARRRSRGEQLRAALVDIVVGRAAQRPGMLGHVASTWLQARRTAYAAHAADAASRPTNRVEMPPAPEFDDDAADRWSVLYRHLIMVDNADYLLVPSASGQALAAARQAVLQRMAAPVVQGLIGDDLMRHPQIRANPAFVGQVPADPGMRWWLFRITHRPLAQFLLECWRREPATA